MSNLTKYVITNHIENPDTIMEEYMLIEGKKEGLEKKYTVNGDLWITRNYIAGKLEGEFLQYYKTGELRFRGNYNNGLLNSKFTEYYLSGKVFSETDFVAGYHHGFYIEYYDLPNESLLDKGPIKKKVFYILGNSDGLCYKYWENGKISSVLFYIAGQIEGLVKEYYESGNIMRISEFQNNKQHGSEITYSDDDGEVLEIKYYNKGLNVDFYSERMEKIESLI